MSKDVTVNFGGGFFGLLTIVLITLKLLGEIQISWFLVLLPLWFLPALLITLLTLIFIGGSLITLGITLSEYLKKD